MQIYGEKKQKGGGQKPNIQKDTTASTNFFQGLYGLSEGEVYGLVDGGKSIKLDGTPLINANGQPNFSNVWWDFRTGTIDQEYIKGFSSVENETNVGVELRHDRPYVRTLTNTQLSAIVVRLSWSALREQKDNGDITGYRIDYAIDVQTDGGAWTPMLTTFIHDKASQGYQRSHRIDLPKARRNWTIRVRRITPNRDSELIGDTMSVAAVTEVIDATLAYPCTSLLALRYDAETFGNVAKVAVRMRGMIIQVPTNYDPIARTYTGLWDGTFKMAYSNNPAWVFYDLCTARRYGLGERLAGKVDKWRLYRLAQYCDEMVDDGMGGKEPRFAVNVYLQKAEDAYSVLQNLASVFRAMTYWDGTQIIVDSDTPKDSVYTFGTSNVTGGAFSYTGTRARDRHSIAKVAYDDPDNDYKTEYVFVRDEYAIAKYGIRQLDINAFGCTSKAQATRVGEWAIKSEQLESETVSFVAGLEGFIPQVGDVISVADNARAGTFVTGRIEKITGLGGRNYTLDRVAGKVGDTFVLGDKTAKITKVSGNTITTDKQTGGQVGQVWAISSDVVAPREYRVMSIAQNDDATFAITALQYERAKFDDSGVRITPKPVSIIRANALDAPESVTITSHTRTHQGQAVTTMTVNWSQVVGAVAYIVEWKKDENAWQTQKIASQSMDIDGVYAGNYQARVRAVDAFGNESDITSSAMTAITGKQGKPPRLARLVVKGLLFGMELGWIFNAGSDDTNFTEIEVSPDGKSNIATLGTFAYPTNKHEITGLQGNLTQFYRGRIVDKLGNTSDWTAWVSGTTSADAGKVLDIISGQINQSHLDQTLRTPIAKIGTLENAVNGIGSKIPSIESAVAGLNRNLGGLNNQLATTQNELNTAKSTLQTAVGNITTERNRINTAIRDIGTLQTANNAKTQELANLTQTVNGHTSQVRDLAVTTGDLSQKYTALKTATDTANSEITAIKQTQSGQATSINRLSSEMSNKASTANLETLQQTLADADSALSERISQLDSAYKQADRTATANLSELERTLTQADSALSERISQLDTDYRSNKSSTSSRLATAEQSLSDARQALSKIQVELESSNSEWGDDIVINGKVAVNNTTAYNTANYNLSQSVQNEKVKITVRASTNLTTIYVRDADSNASIATLSNPVDGVFTAEIQVNAALNRIRLDRLPYYQRASIFEVSVQKQSKSVQAQLSELKQTVTDADSALSQRIGQMDSAYKQADRTAAAQIGQLERTLTQADNALSERIGQLSTQIRQPNGQYATATALDEVKSSVRQVDGRLTSEAGKISTLQTTVGGQTASIRNVEDSVNGVRAIKAVTVDNNGFISGYGLMSELQNGRVTSRFGINADQIYFGATTSAKKPFVFTTRTTTIDGVSYPAGAWLNSASIANASITNAHIANATITSAKIANGAIDNAKIANGAIDSAKIGEAAITTAKIGVAQVDTLQIAGEAVISPRYQETDWGSQYQAGVEHTVLRFTMNTQGSAVCLLFGWKKILASAWHQSSATVIIKIKRDDLVLHEDGFSFSSAWNSANSNQSSPPIFDFNPPNNPVYTVVISYHGDRPSVRAEGIRILGLAIKR